MIITNKTYHELVTDDITHIHFWSCSFITYKYKTREQLLNLRNYLSPGR